MSGWHLRQKVGEKGGSTLHRMETWTELKNLTQVGCSHYGQLIDLLAIYDSLRYLVGRGLNTAPLAYLWIYLYKFVQKKCPLMKGQSGFLTASAADRRRTG